MWTVEAFESEPIANDLAIAIGAGPLQIRRFEHALVSWLRAYGDAIEAPPHQGRAVPGRDTRVDQELSDAVAKLNDPRAALYAWSRLLKAQDSLWDFAFGWGITGPLLRLYVEALTPSELDWQAGVSVIEYLASDMADSPNSGAFDELWNLAERALVFEGPEARQRVLSALLDVVQRRGYHHKLTDLERLLRVVCDGDAAIQRKLRVFRPANRQGAAIVAGAVMRIVPVRSQTSAADAADLLAWLVDARKDPTKRWLRRLDSLKERIPNETFASICSEIRTHPEYARHDETGWRDDLFWFMWKSAAWYNGETPERILGQQP